MMGQSQRSGRSVRRALGGRLGSLLLVALGTALVVGSGAGVYLALGNVPRARPVETKPVVMVALEVGERLPIPAEALRLVQAPVELVPDGAVAGLEEVEGKATASRLMPGEMLLKHRLVERAADSTGLAGFLQPNEVAVTFPAAGIAGVAGLVPGDRVDVLVTLRPGAASGLQPVRGPYTTVALQDLRVLSVSKPGGAARQGSVAARAGSLVPLGGVAEGSGQVVFAATYSDALFLKSLKDADNVILDLVLRPLGKPDLVAGEGVTMSEGFRLRSITVP